MINKSVLKINYQVVILTQYASFMSSFSFILKIIENQFYQKNIQEKFNLIPHHFFFIFSLIIPFVTIIFKEKQQRIKKIQTFYDCACNFFIPVTSIFGNLPLFFLLNFCFYIFSIFLAFHAKDFKINKIILSSYLILFHIGFLLLTVINKQDNQQIYEMINFVMQCILFLGAVHQVLNLLFGTLYNIFISIKDKLIQNTILIQNIDNFETMKQKNFDQIKVISKKYKKQLKYQRFLKITQRKDKNLQFFISSLFNCYSKKQNNSLNS